MLNQELNKEVVSFMQEMRASFLEVKAELGEIKADVAELKKMLQFSRLIQPNSKKMSQPSRPI